MRNRACDRAEPCLIGTVTPKSLASPETERPATAAPHSCKASSCTPRSHELLVASGTASTGPAGFRINFVSCDLFATPAGRASNAPARTILLARGDYIA